MRDGKYVYSHDLYDRFCDAVGEVAGPSGKHKFERYMAYSK